MGDVFHKFCPRCLRDLPLEMFSRNRAKPDGMQIHCKDCMKTFPTSRKEYREKYREENRDRISEYRRRYRRERGK